ncbi:MAG: cyclase family protein [Gemmatimonadaceae bacterium]
MLDISIPLGDQTPEWPGDTPYSCGWTWSIAAGASVNVSAITTSPHVGTHADAPLHVRDGAPASEALPLDAFMGEALIVDVSDCQGAIEHAQLEARGWKAGTLRLLLRTGQSIAAGPFPTAWPALSPACAASLAADGLRLLGVDCPSVDDRESTSLDVHHALFDDGACVLENLDLRAVAPGRYELLAQPLKVHGLDAAPVRAVLRALTVEAGAQRTA